MHIIKFSSIQQFFFFGLLISTTILFLWMIGSYLMPVFWAVVSAIIFYPLYKYIERLTKGRSSLASILAILAVTLVVVVPITVIGTLIAQESLALYQSINQNGANSEGLSMLERAERFTLYLEPYGISREVVITRIREGLANVAQQVASSILAVGQTTFSLFISAIVMLYLLFFFFRDAQKLQQTLIHYLPIGDEYEKRLFVRFAETARAVVKGTLAIAILQGFLGGMAFWLVGIANPVLWGVAMGVLAIFPALGPAFVWFPASLILLLTGSIWEGVTIMIVGLLLVSLVDEFLRPILVGRGSKMPDSITLLATIGGLATFGISGFVIGPIVAAFFLTLWVMFEEQYKKELIAN